MFNKNLFAPFAEDDATDELADYAAGKSYLPLDEAIAVGTPSTIKRGWHEEEFDQRAAEQEPLWAANGEKAAKPFTVTAARYRSRRDVAEHQIVVQRSVFTAAKENFDLHTDALEGYTRREPHAKVMYLLRWALLLLGDIAGISGAAILLGEVVDLAVLQAVASAVAAVTAGLVGNDIRDARLARRRARDLKDMPEKHGKFAWLFNGSDVGEKIVKAMILVGITTTVLIVGGIFALRDGVEGSLGGIVFGCLAGAICLASALNTYQYADEIADLLDHAYSRYLRASKRLAKLAENEAIAAYDANTVEAESIRTEHAYRGEAAAKKVTAMKHSISFDNPAVMGHGPAADPKPAIDPEQAASARQGDLFSSLAQDLSGLSANGVSGNGNYMNGSRA